MKMNLQKTEYLTIKRREEVDLHILEAVCNIVEVCKNLGIEMKWKMAHEVRRDVQRKII